MHHLLDGEVVQGRAHVQGERKDLIERALPLAADERPQGGAVQVLEDEMWTGPVEDGAEPANYDGMVEALDQLGFEGQASPGPVLRQQVGAKHLDDDDGEEPAVPGQVRLVELTAAEALEGDAPGDDLIALAQLPARTVRHRGR